MKEGDTIGRYEIRECLAEGGMARVFRVWHRDLHRFEAMKTPLPHLALDPSFSRRFVREARTSAALAHSGIVALYAVSEDTAAERYFTMELVEGGDLSDLLRRRGRLSLAEALPLLRQIAGALDYAHSRGVLHRDMKPSNILLTAEGQAKVADFGIARAQEGESGERVTHTGIIVGTPEYMSPEQAGSGAAIGAASDQYSLAVIAYEMLCGAPPFRQTDGTSPLSVILAHVRDEPRPPMEQVSGLSPAANAAILKALSKDAGERFGTCSAFVDAMLEARDTRRDVLPSGRPRLALAGLAILLLAGVNLLAVGMRRVSAPPPIASASPAVPLSVPLAPDPSGSDTVDLAVKPEAATPDAAAEKRSREEALLRARAEAARALRRAREREEARAEIEGRLEIWRAARQGKDMYSYLACYGFPVRHKGVLRSRDALERYEQHFFDIHDNIDIAFRRVRVTIDGDRATVKFRQRYQAYDTARGVPIDWDSDKALRMVRTGDGWKIQTESS